ncbi:MAG TPA: hypothetical protein VLV16_00870 [Gemmatimonadales bacterium]|nr:hypothetical protein [Gemmatimonadales bacterium]
MTWAVVSLAFVQTIVLGLAVVPAAWLLRWSSSWALVFRAMMIAPAYVVFALALMVLSAAAIRLFGWRTPADAAMRITEVDWPLLDWVRYLALSHIVRLCAGSLFRATPLWTAYHRWNGARLGRGVYINSLAITDDNLLEFGDHVVIGHGVHLSGHTVERGVVRTGTVRLGPDVTIGVEAVIGIGVEIGAGTQVGALSVVPKYQRLEGGAVFAGAPVHRIDVPDVNERSTRPDRWLPPASPTRIPPRAGTAPSRTRGPREA